MPPPRSIAGQASAEYVALLAVVGAIVAGAAAVGSPPSLALDGRGGGAPRDLPRRGRDLHERRGARGRARPVPRPGAHGPRAARRAAAGRAARARRRAARRAPLGRLGRGLLHGRRQRGRDGRRRACRSRAGRASASAAGWACSSTRAGRGSSRPSPRRRASCGAGRRGSRSAARRSGLLRRACPICRHAAARRRCRRPTRPSTRAVPYGEFAAALRVGVRRAGAGAEEEGEAGLILGRRVARGGRVTWYDRVDLEAAGRLGAVLGAVQARSARARWRSRSRPCTGGPSSCGCARRRAGTATSTCPAGAGSLRDVAAAAARRAGARRRAGSAAASRPRSRST